MFRSAILGLVMISVSMVSGRVESQVSVDDQLPEYAAVDGIVGSVKSTGSDTMNNVMTLWGELFMKEYPQATVQVDGKGSSTAPPALTEGQSQFGPMSRLMKSAEVDRFESVHGYKPTVLRTGIDCLAVFVNKDCPLESVTLEQLERIFSVAGPDMTWGDLGIEDSRYRNQPIALYGRNSASGTYGYFKKYALGGQDYKATVKEQPGSSAVIQAVGSDPYSMGYSGIGYATQDVKALRVGFDDQGDAVEPSAEAAYSGEYPLARFLYVYINHNPARALDPLRREFIKLIYSKQGQEAVLKDGYFPIPASIARKELESVGISVDF